MMIPAMSVERATHKNATARPAESCSVILGTFRISWVNSRASLENSFANCVNDWRETRTVTNFMASVSGGISILTFWKKSFNNSNICKTASSSRMPYLRRHSVTAVSKLFFSSFTIASHQTVFHFRLLPLSMVAAATFRAPIPVLHKNRAANFATADD